MTRVEAAEDSFSRANTYFLLSWVVTALILVTALVDYRALRREVAVTEERITTYTGLERLSSMVATDLRSAIYVAPGYAGIEEGIEEIRRLRSDLLAQIVWMEDNYARLSPQLTTDDRKIIQPALTYMKSMLLLNAPWEGVSVPDPDEPHMLLADHVAGSYLTSETVAGLRMEDAARYLWLASLDLRHWSTLLKTHRNALVAGTPRSTMADDFAPIIAASKAPARKARRAQAASAWSDWLTSSFGSGTGTPDTQISEAERRRRQKLTLANSSQYLDEAIARRAELDLIQQGEATTVEVPVFSTPLQLRDAVVLAPWFLAFSSLAIMIYTRRGMRYAPKIADADTVVGKVPSFFLSPPFLF